MKISFKNLGVLKNAEVDLSKDLVILCGPNNTGKTYVTYAVYGLSKVSALGNFDSSSVHFSYKEDDAIFSQSDYDIDLVEFYKQNKKAIFNLYIKNFTTNIHTLFATSRASFNNFSLSITETSNDIFINRLVALSGTTRLLSSYKNTSFSFSKNKDSALIHIESSGKDKQPPNTHIIKNLVDGVLLSFIKEAFAQAYFFPAERIAINLFDKEVLLYRNELISKYFNLSGGTGNTSPDFINKNATAYSLPIKDSLDIANQLFKHKKNKSPFASFASEIEKDILGGQMSVTDENVVQFTPDEANKFSLDIHLSSSIVKSLSSLVFYFRHMAQSGDMLIIDEPELNLHPDMQRRVARILAKAVNKGFKVIISTHSDYIIRELNNLIMLHQPSRKAKDLRKKYGYLELETLGFQRVGAYLFQNQQAKELEVSETGFEVATIDKEINDLNNAAEEIFFSLFD